LKITNINHKLNIDDDNIKERLNQNTRELNKNDSLLDEFLNFKNENMEKYKFDIQEKYILPKNSKIIKEVQSEGKMIRFYENNVIDVISKNQNITRVKN